MEVRPIGGLCNRLRVIGSRLHLARTVGKSLSVWWWNTPDCPARFCDLFETPPTDLIVYENVACPPHVEVTCYVNPTYSVAEWIPTALAALKPLPPLQTRIDTLLSRLGSDFSAVHIRRTDHNARYDEDAVYSAFAAETPSQKCFCAADNPRSIATLKQALGDQLVYAGQFSIVGKRMTAVADAVVDLWVASHATRFRGTYYSSFSDWIEGMRRFHGLPAGDCSKIKTAE